MVFRGVSPTWSSAPALWLWAPVAPGSFIPAKASFKALISSGFCSLCSSSFGSSSLNSSCFSPAWSGIPELTKAFSALNTLLFYLDYYSLFPTVEPANTSSLKKWDSFQIHLLSISNPRTLFDFEELSVLSNRDFASNEIWKIIGIDLIKVNFRFHSITSAKSSFWKLEPRILILFLVFSSIQGLMTAQTPVKRKGALTIYILRN